jgi:predicted PurR-regulated permease PerM
MVIAIGVAAAALYVAQEVLIPLALAILLAFLLAPVVTRLERLKIGRAPAVLIVVTIAFLAVFTIGWVVGKQVISLAESLPAYQNEITRKAQSLRGRGSGFSSRIEHFGQELERATVEPTTRPTTAEAAHPAATQSLSKAAEEQFAPDPAQGVARQIAGGPPPVSPSAAGLTPANPLFTVSLPAPVSPIKTLGTYLGLVLGPLGTAGLVIVFVIFMLLEREDLRDRLIRLISRGRYTVTTRAIDDAATRISRYILAQSLINGTYGLAVGLGLFVIGLTFGHGTLFPSFVLWGLMSGLLRFVPYVGAITAALFPIALSLAVYPGFEVFIAVAVLLVLIELVTSNVLEPWLYGTSTGISTVALLVAAVFWTWLWGPVGLLLATPLTVCIVVLGKHVPQLKFLDVLLGDQPALPPAVSYYQRLLAGDKKEAADLVLEVAKEKGADQVPDEVLIPALLRSRHYRKEDDLSPEGETAIHDATKEIVQRLVQKADSKSSDVTPTAPVPPVDVLGCPAHHRSEELVIEMLAGILKPLGCNVAEASTRLLPSDIESWIERDKPSILFIAALPPGGIVQARYLCRRLRRKFPELRIVVGYWGRARNFDALLIRLRAAGANYVTTSLLQTRSQIAALLNLSPTTSTPASGAVNLEETPVAPTVTSTLRPQTGS